MQRSTRIERRWRQVRLGDTHSNATRPTGQWERRTEETQGMTGDNAGRMRERSFRTGLPAYRLYIILKNCNLSIGSTRKMNTTVTKVAWDIILLFPYHILSAPGLISSPFPQVNHGSKITMSFSSTTMCYSGKLNISLLLAVNMCWKIKFCHFLQF